MNKISVSISGHRTAISLESEFIDALKTAAKSENKSVAALIKEIDDNRGRTNLSSAIRVYLLKKA